MGLISKEVEINLHPSNIKYYEELGYYIPKKIGKYAITVSIGTTIKVKVEDLPKGSNVKVEVKCDCEQCKKPNIKLLSWQDYKKQINKYGKYYCRSCKMKLHYNKTRKYKYNIGDIILTKNNGKIQILEQITILNTRKSFIKGYKYKCLIDGNIDKINEVNLHSGKTGCNVCGNRKILKGYNDLWTTHPNIAKLLKYPERGYEINYGKTEPEIFVCPDCGYEKSLNINSLIRQYNFPCPICNDGFPYPEKYTLCLFNQLKENHNINNFEYQYSPDWIKPKKYDFYFEINNKKYILETDGGWHSKDNKMSGQTAEESKKLKAKEHNIEVIRIDCIISDLEYIKNNILSKLNILFNLSKIDWFKCHEFALSNRVKESCNLWNNGIKSTRIISNKMEISIHTTIKYLKQGAKIGWCNYTVEDAKIIGREKSKITNKIRSIKIICITTNKIFNSIKEAGDFYNIKSFQNNVCKHLKGKRNYVGKHPETGEKLKWMYYDEYIEQQNKNA